MDSSELITTMMMTLAGSCTPSDDRRVLFLQAARFKEAIQNSQRAALKTRITSKTGRPILLPSLTHTTGLLNSEAHDAPPRRPLPYT